MLAILGRRPAAAALSFGLLVLINTAGAATIVVTGPQTGAPGAPGTGTVDPGNPNRFDGNQGAPGYAATSAADTYLFNNALATGGGGGAVTAADSNPDHVYYAGTGGSGVAVLGSPGVVPTATINTGMYEGGVGGTASGTAAGELNGGYGGDGAVALYANVVINNGVFVGGFSGTATGTAGSLGSGFAGSGLNVNNGAVVRVNNGTFEGGNGAVVPGGGTGAAGAGLIGLGGDAVVYGGVFDAGTGNSPGYDIDLYIGTITLVGTDFRVDGVPVTGNTITGSGTLTGRLANNTADSTLTFINRDFGGTIFVTGVPEPLSLTWLAFSGLAMVRRRR